MGRPPLDDVEVSLAPSAFLANAKYHILIQLKCYHLFASKKVFFCYLSIYMNHDLIKLGMEKKSLKKGVTTGILEDADGQQPSA
jgi:hypothetical protein